MRLINRSGYDTGDLATFFGRALEASGAVGDKTVVVTASPIRSRGCADVGISKSPKGEGADIVIAMASPSRFSMRRLARLIDHELLHVRGHEHNEMNERDLFSLGPVPAWARGLHIRYQGRAPSQIP